MADGNNQRPFPPNEPYVRGAPAAASAPGGGDPLAELARLIGQNDPFSEFPRDPRRAAAPQQQAAPAVDWGAQPAHGAFPSPLMAPDPRMDAPAYGNGGQYAAQDAGRDLPQFGAPGMAPPPFGGQQFQAGADMYPPAHEDAGFPDAEQSVPGFAQDPYFRRNAALTPEGDDYYDDDPPPRRRFSVIAIGAAIALAVLGTAGAFGYRALFGSSGTTPPPPVIKADTAPSKIVPAVASAEQSNKLIQDRVGSGQGEKLVSREEQPMERQGKPDGVVFPGAAANMMQAGVAPPMANGSGVIVGEPKRIRTIVIRPDQPVIADPAAPKPAPERASTRVASAASPAADEDRRPAARAAPPPVRTAATPPPPPSNAPLSLNPNADDAPPARTSPQPVRPAPAAPAAPTPITPQLASAPSGGNGNYAVQISSQRSEVDAQASFRNLQNRHSNLLGGHTPIIRRVDLGDRGIYYRALVGPFSSSGAASDLCSSLKAAGADCLIQRN